MHKKKSKPIRGFIPALVVIVGIVVIPFVGLKVLDISSNHTNTTPTLQEAENPTWIPFINEKYKYQISYPHAGKIYHMNPDGTIKEITAARFTPSSSSYKNDDPFRSKSVSFDLPVFGVPVFYVSVIDENLTENTYNHHTLEIMEKAFQLKIGEKLDPVSSNDVSNTELLLDPGVFERLPNKTIHGQEFVVIQNPKAYGGISKILLTKKGNKMYELGAHFSDLQDNDSETFFNSFKFLE